MAPRWQLCFQTSSQDPTQKTLTLLRLARHSRWTSPQDRPPKAVVAQGNGWFRDFRIYLPLRGDRVSVPEGRVAGRTRLRAEMPSGEG